MTRPPLELLELWAVWRAECDEVRRLHAENADSSEVQARMSTAYAALFAVPAEEVRAASAALRAQAEAEGKYRLMVAAWVAAEDRLRELDERGTHADWEAGNERLCAAEATMYAAFTPDQARAALAQADAGGEG